MSQSPDEPAAAAGELDLTHLARLARLSLTEEEAALVHADLQNIIAMIDTMQGIDTTDVAPMASPLDAIQRLRADEVSEADQRDNFMRNAPDSDGGYYLVPRVVE